ncbi:L-serine dehydratase [Pilibacter termitis]|uniref:L-serine deaminase n=1 Tax=Pilibacter termitis TaxID=263852 RepID=A0A1T4K5A2_9ENTE|nr:L-serine ammonia-lyase, iron-sulfur-dependent subunit beta [Pilibacter termitis]SJZ37596.1 L-serine dehydratase [Pilibacter termitis]
MKSIRYKSVFDIIGPVMVGPSSSHTAGAARIGKIVRSIFGEAPEKVDIHLYESFAKTYRGHGTDIAIVGGLLGMNPDDNRLSQSLKLAYEEGIEVAFIPHKEDRAEHPNTARIVLEKGEKKMSATGISIGGGNIQVTELNGFDISLSMGTPTFIIVHQDVPGMIAKVTNILSANEINIAQMNVTRASKGDKAIMIIEVDSPRVEDVCQEIKDIPHLHNVSFFH